MLKGSSCVLPPSLTSHDGTAVAQHTSTATVDTGRTTAAVVTQTVWVTTQSPVGLTNHPGAAATTNPDTHVGLNPKPTATSMEATAASAVDQMTGSSWRSQTLSQTTSRPPESQTQQHSSQLDEANSETGKNSTAPLPEHAESSSSLTASQTTGPQPNSTAKQYRQYASCDRSSAELPHLRGDQESPVAAGFAVHHSRCCARLCSGRFRGTFDKIGRAHV